MYGFYSFYLQPLKPTTQANPSLALFFVDFHHRKGRVAPSWLPVIVFFFKGYEVGHRFPEDARILDSQKTTAHGSDPMD